MWEDIMEEIVKILMLYPKGTVLLLDYGKETVQRTVVGYDLNTEFNNLKLDNGTQINVKRLEGKESILVRKALPILVPELIEYFDELDD
jgi:hypothetical protein